jgi:hypothetical protein
MIKNIKANTPRQLLLLLEAKKLSTRGATAALREEQLLFK